MTEQDYLDLLPPLDLAQLQLSLGYMLGGLHYTKLGDYPNFDALAASSSGFLRAVGKVEAGVDDSLRIRLVSDGRVFGPLKQLRARLSDIETQIDERNTVRGPYDLLRPSQVPMSVNV